MNTNSRFFDLRVDKRPWYNKMWTEIKKGIDRFLAFVKIKKLSNT